jgi:hypothetical protein
MQDKKYPPNSLISSAMLKNSGQKIKTDHIFCYMNRNYARQVLLIVFKLVTPIYGCSRIFDIASVLSGKQSKKAYYLDTLTLSKRD